MISRRYFIQSSASIATIPLISGTVTAQPPNTALQEIDKGTRMDYGLVKEIVGQSHRDLDKVKALFTQEDELKTQSGEYNSWFLNQTAQSALVNASFDWGSGDFETPLGAASHMGRKDIIDFLLSKGARFNIFAAAAMGKLDIVKPALIHIPSLLTTKGPHGIPLIVHANKGLQYSENFNDEKGIEESKAVLDFMKKLTA